MSDLTSLREFFQDTEVDFQSVLSEPLYQKFGGVINFLIDSLAETFKLGDIHYSGLTQSEMDGIFGAGVWVKPTGQSIIGTDYEVATGRSTAPDCRGLFLRGFDDGAGVDSGRAINTFQSSSTKPHQHIICAATDVIGSTFNVNTTRFISNVRADSAKLQGFGGDIGATRTSGSDGIAEGRPKNTAVYIYLKVNN